MRSDPKHDASIDQNMLVVAIGETAVLAYTTYPTRTGDRMPGKVLQCCLLLAALLGATAAQAQVPVETIAPPARPAAPTPPPPPKLPADVTTHHTLQLPGSPGRTLQFSATAGAIRLVDDKGAPQADVAFIAYQLDGADPATRKVTFVLNGGPGIASGWLQVGAVGPWRIALSGDARAPSASPRHCRTPIRGWTSPTWCSSTRSIPASRAC